MSTLPPGISGPEMLSMLLVQARVRPAVLAAVREQIPANRSGTKKTHLRMHWDHEPTPDPSQEGSSIDRTAPRLEGVSGGLVADWFMESPLSVFFRMHCDHEPETRKPFRIKASVFRFMESLLSPACMLGDHEPARPRSRRPPAPRKHPDGVGCRGREREGREDRFMGSENRIPSRGLFMVSPSPIPAGF